MQSSAAASLAGVVGGCARTPLFGRAAKPNVIVILADDLGFGDLGSFGSRDLQTPNIDSISDNGIKFVNAYSNCPVCSPTRAALLSGRYQELVGVPGVIRTHRNDSWGRLTPDSVLLPKVLKTAGYRTAIIGKWHLGLDAPNTPNARGVDHFHGFLGDMMDDYYTHRRHDINYMRLNEQEIDPQGHATDLFTDWACDYIENADRRTPFFLYLAYNAPHTPIQPPQEWVERYKQRHPDADEERAKLAGLIEHMDDGIGKVLDTLKRQGLEEETLVIFTSDNGGYLRVNADNGPYRDGKGSMYEGGIRVPMCAQWRGKIQPGTVTKRTALSMDIFPTVLETAGATVRHEIDGVSFLPELLSDDRRDPQRDLFFGRREGGAFNGKTIEAIRRGDWKLLRPMPNEPLELYNIKNDPFETTNLAQSNPAKFNELKAALERQLEAYSKVPWEPA